MPHRERSPYEPKHRRGKQPYRKPFRLRNIVTVKPQPGYYKFYDKKKKPIYIGSSKQLGPSNEDPKKQGRLMDVYYGRGDYRQTASKRVLRKKIAKFDVHYGKNIYDNREHEREKKKGLPYNKR